MQFLIRMVAVRIRKVQHEYRRHFSDDPAGVGEFANIHWRGHSVQTLFLGKLNQECLQWREWGSRHPELHCLGLCSPQQSVVVVEHHFPAVCGQEHKVPPIQIYLVG